MRRSAMSPEALARLLGWSAPDLEAMLAAVCPDPGELLRGLYAEDTGLPARKLHRQETPETAATRDAAPLRRRRAGGAS